MEEETRYFYQPDLTGAIISWSWTFLIFVAGLVVWLVCPLCNFNLLGNQTAHRPGHPDQADF